MEISPLKTLILTLWVQFQVPVSVTDRINNNFGNRKQTEKNGINIRIKLIFLPCFDFPDMFKWF